MYGATRLMGPLAAVARLPHLFQVSAGILGYLVLVVATRAWLELSTGKLRFFF